jgi:hypothetical protein
MTKSYPDRRGGADQALTYDRSLLDPDGSTTFDTLDPYDQETIRLSCDVQTDPEYDWMRRVCVKEQPGEWLVTFRVPFPYYDVRIGPRTPVAHIYDDVLCGECGDSPAEYWDRSADRLLCGDCCRAAEEADRAAEEADE